MLRIGRIGPAAEGQQTASTEEAFRHFAASFGQTGRFAREEAVEVFVSCDQPLFHLTGEFTCSQHASVLTNSRQRIADEHINDAAAAVTSSDQYRPSRLLADFSDDLSVVPARRQGQGVDRSVSVLWGHDGEKLAFIRDVERVQPQQLTGSPDRIPHRNLIFKQKHSQTAIARKFVEGGRSASAGGIPHPADAGPRGVYKGFY